jgi:cobalt-zinc-cadmium efflux system outer membrane protein
VAEAASNASVLAAEDQRDALVRDLRQRYEDLAALDAEREITRRQQLTLESYGSTARLRYGLGTAQQSDALLAETQLARLRRQILTLNRRQIELQAGIAKLAGRAPAPSWPRVAPQLLHPPPEPLTDLLASNQHRPGVATVRAGIVNAQREIDLAQREFYPDFDLRLDYGRRQRAPDGMPRDDMVSLTVSVNLPIWRERRLRPQVIAAQAMLREREAMALSMEQETASQLMQQHAIAHEARAIVELTDQSLLPVSQAAVSAAVAGYRVGRVEFLALLEAQMRVFDAELERITAIAEHNRALADIDYLTGRWPLQLGPQP